MSVLSVRRAACPVEGLLVVLGRCVRLQRDQQGTVEISCGDTADCQRWDTNTRTRVRPEAQRQSRIRPLCKVLALSCKMQMHVQSYDQWYKKRGCLEKGAYSPRNFGRCYVESIKTNQGEKISRRGISKSAVGSSPTLSTTAVAILCHVQMADNR